MNEYFAQIYSLDYEEDGEVKTVFSEDKEKLEALLVEWEFDGQDISNDEIKEHKFNHLCNLLLYVNYKLGTEKIFLLNGVES